MTSGSNGGSSNPLIAAAAAIPFPNPRRTFVQARFSQLDTKDVVAAESKIELSDLLQEITTELKAVYRSKFIFGDYLKHVDANYSGDGGAEFNVAAPPPFEPGYLTVKKAGEGDDKLGGLGGGAVGGPGGGGGGGGGVGGGGGGGGGGDGDPSREKLRTAEELIKKLYKRNSLLEVENKYLKGTGKQQQEQQQTRKGSGGSAGRGRSANEIGQIPRHPMLTAKYVRRACSAPPTRLLVGRGGGGGGSGAKAAASAADPKAAAAADPTGDAAGAAAAAAADSFGTQALKGRVQALTEALVACQHEHHRLLQEKRERVSLRDSVIRRYLVERDTAIGQLHVLLTEVQDKLANPMRLTRVKQPGGGVNPVVAGNNMLKEVGTKLNEQICQVTKALLQAGAGAGAGAGGDGTKDSLLQAALGSDAVPPELAGRRRELLRRVRALAESLPVGKKKALLQLVLELKQVNRALVGAKETVLSTYEALKVRLNNELIKEKLEAAYLRDKVRSYGGTIEDELPFTPAYT